MDLGERLKRPISKRVAAAVIVCVTLLLIVLAIPRVRANWGGRQAERMAACQTVIDRELGSLGDDPRWQEIEFHASTNETVYVHGWVRSEDDAKALWGVVSPLATEVPLTWAVQVRDWYPPDGRWVGHPDWWPDRRVGSWQE